MTVLIDRRRWVMVGLVRWHRPHRCRLHRPAPAFIPDEDQGYGLGIFQLQNGASLSETQKTAARRWPRCSTRRRIIDGSVVSGYGFNGASPDQGVFFYRPQAAGGTAMADQRAPAS